MTRLASHFKRFSARRSNSPLGDEEIRCYAPSIFAASAHDSRSQRYRYIPTIEVLNALRREGFQPFMVCQALVRDDSRRDFAKHMLRLRHASRIDGEEANEIVLLNSHDGSSSYQMLAGVFRFVCQNGMVCGETLNDIRVPHRGDVVGNVIEGAYRILDDFERMDSAREAMKALTLSSEEQTAFARASLALRYEGDGAVLITEAQVLTPQRDEDRKSDLWTTFNVVQENLTQGGLAGRDRSGRRMTTRPVQGIDGNVKLNRALWVLADEMKKLKG